MSSAELAWTFYQISCLPQMLAMITMMYLVGSVQQAFFGWYTNEDTIQRKQTLTIGKSCEG